MIKRLAVVALTCSTLACFAQAPVLPYFQKAVATKQAVTHQPGEVVPGQLLVLVESNAQMPEIARALTLQGYTVNSTTLTAASMHIWTVQLGLQDNLELALKSIRQVPGVRVAQYNHYVAERVNVPNDTQFGTMWDMDNTGQNGGTPDADIDAPEAWDITTGGLTALGDTIVVAVIDGGFELTHSDLNFWKNYGEIPNNAIDDDNNGYVDDYNGWNAYTGNGIMPTNNHGTHVTGTVGAIGNNALGVVGVNWGVKVMAVAGSSNTESTVVAAYTYVLDQRRLYNQTNGAQGAFVVATNSSFGVDQGQPANFPIWCALYDSMGVQGILSAAATANQNWDIDVMGDIPTACSSSYMIAVTNTTRNDVKTTSAGYGLTTIDLGSPGTSVLSTILNNGYGTLSGTSMATPHVAGAIALMYAAACPQFITNYKTDPATLALQMRTYLLAGVDPLTALNGQCVTGGRLNLNGALQQVQTYNCTTLVVEPFHDDAALTLQPIFPNPANDWVQVTYDAPGQAEVDFVVYNVLGEVVMRVHHVANGGVNVQKLDVSGLSGGVYVVRVEAGGRVSAGQRIVVN